MQLIYYTFNFLFGSKTTEDNTRDPHSTIFRAWSGNLPQATSVLRVFFSIMGSAESRSVSNLACLVKRVCVHDLVSVLDVPHKPATSASDWGFCETQW